MNKRIRFFLKFVIFFLIASVSGLAASLLSAHFLRTSKTRYLNLGGAFGMRGQLAISQKVVDSDGDGIADSLFIFLAGVPGLEATYLLTDRNQNGVFDRMFMHSGTDSGSHYEAFFLYDVDSDDVIDHSGFWTSNRLDPTGGVAYMHRDLDRNGVVDVVTPFKDGRFGHGRILYKDKWLRYARSVPGTFLRQVDLEDDSGNVSIATFEDGHWRLGSEEDVRSDVSEPSTPGPE